ncbi:C6 transcription factor, putative [Aspergillus lentulus]|nr:C6 transcription factor, putative [Aspergillus lentulus]
MRCTWPVNADASSPSPSELNCYIFPATLMTSPFLMTLLRILRLPLCPRVSFSYFSPCLGGYLSTLKNTLVALFGVFEWSSVGYIGISMFPNGICWLLPGGREPYDCSIEVSYTWRLISLQGSQKVFYPPVGIKY